jgi:hypothetical protein
MKCCEMLFSKILKTDHSLFDDIPCKEEMICTSHIGSNFEAKFILANCEIVYGIMHGQLQLDDGGEIHK